VRVDDVAPSTAEGTSVKIVMTLMVRDEADIVGAMLAHHQAQGIDHVVVTDNGSIDGTPQILRRFEEEGFATVWHDPVHRKQQHSTVTKMARYASTELGADWVLNADADEFWVTTSPDRTLKDALASVAPEVPFLVAQVVNLTGAPARDGSGLGRLHYQDRRTADEIRRAGIPFHPTADAVHRADPMVEVSQGNHFVKAPGWGEGQPTDEIEVLHLPWRSWRQYEHKVRVSGEAYLANPELSPSPRHHGMQDFRRLREGQLEMVYVAKHPLDAELNGMLERGSLVPESRLAALDGTRFPGRIEDALYTDHDRDDLGRTGREVSRVEARYEVALQELRDDIGRIIADRDRIADELAAANRARADLEEIVRGYAGRLSVRAADKVGRGLRALSGRAR
jgi:hypothetical protein